MHRQEPGLRVGCSGWQYRHWRSAFYPATLPTSHWLPYYASRFDTVEINNTFYRLPDAATFVRWREALPAGFLAAIKASRFLTHMKKLVNPAEPLERLFSRAAGLGECLGPVLYQLPATLRRDLPRLDAFLSLLPRRLADASGRERPIRHVMEFRDPSWYEPEVFEVLVRHGVALCLHDRAGSPTPEIAVGPFIYVRFHGSSGAYHGGYAREDLAARARWLAIQHASGRDIFVYFNNDIGARAPADAITLRALLFDAVTASARSASRPRAAAARSGDP
jgi:uncharacterized protein YecE (DUF72 family)